MANLELDKQLEKMRTDWDERARENARYLLVSTGKKDWTDEEFFRSGEQTVSEEILTDMINICQGKDPKQMRVLEIGCGAGRITRALAGLFGEVHAVDVSGGDGQQGAGRAGRSTQRLHLSEQRQGPPIDPRRPSVPLRLLHIVFQHIPSYAIIESYVREVHRLLRPGALFKFQCKAMRP